MNSDPFPVSEWAVQFAPRFLEAIGAPNLDPALAADGLDSLYESLPVRDAGGRDPRSDLRDALKGIKALNIHLGYGSRIMAAWRSEVVESLVHLEKKFAEFDGPDFEPLEINGSARIVVWDLRHHLAALERAITARIEELDSEKRARAHRPREEWKHETMFAFVWIAYELRRQAGVVDPVPSMKNGVLEFLSGFAVAELRVADATAESYARKAAALVARVRKGTLSTADRRLAYFARGYIPKQLEGELADIDDPDDLEIEAIEKPAPDPLSDLRRDLIERIKLF